MIVVVDASVALKWFFDTRDDEAHIEEALAILEGIEAGDLQMLQPPHFLAEVAAVLAREKPGDALDDLHDLQQVDWEIIEDPAVYAMAVDICARSGRHLFDTLYHATALHAGHATLVTADNRYFETAREIGSIERLANFRVPQ